MKPGDKLGLSLVQHDYLCDPIGDLLDTYIAHCRLETLADPDTNCYDQDPCSFLF